MKIFMTNNTWFTRFVMIIRGSAVFDAAIIDGNGLTVRPANRLDWEEVGISGLSDY